jgi:hypothetical protein
MEYMSKIVLSSTLVIFGLWVFNNSFKHSKLIDQYLEKIYGITNIILGIIFIWIFTLDFIIFIDLIILIILLVSKIIFEIIKIT